MTRPKQSGDFHARIDVLQTPPPAAICSALAAYCRGFDQTGESALDEARSHPERLRANQPARRNTRMIRPVPDTAESTYPKARALQKRRSVARHRRGPEGGQPLQSGGRLRGRRLVAGCGGNLLPGCGIGEVLGRPFAPRRSGRQNAQRRQDHQDRQRDPKRLGRLASRPRRFVRVWSLAIAPGAVLATAMVRPVADRRPRPLTPPSPPVRRSSGGRSSWPESRCAADTGRRAARRRHRGTAAAECRTRWRPAARRG